MSAGLGVVRAGAGRRGVNRFFTERRLELSASGVALLYVIALASQLMGYEWLLRPGRRNCIDFTWIWLSGKFALSSAPVRIYDHSAFSAARVALVGPPDCLIGQFDNPPTLLFFTYPLGLMPYSAAFAVWMAATLLLYLGAVYAIIPRPAAVIAAVAPSPVFFNVALGHNGFLTAGLIGLTLVFIERRSWLSGIFLGLLTYKPQFGLLFPFALLASRNWRAFVSAATASVILGVAAAIAFGYQTWPSFVDALVYRASSLSEDPRLAIPLVSIFGFLLSVGVGRPIAWNVQLAVAAIVAARVCWLWARPVPYSLKAAALAIGSVIVTPHAIGYDVCILTIAVAFLVSDGLARGFLPGERGIMLMCWAGLFLLAGPIPAIMCIVLLMLVVRRTVLRPEEALATPLPALMGPGPQP